VGLFRRKKDLVDPNERSAQLGIKHKDLMVLNQMVKHGADLSVPRHVLHYSHFTSWVTSGPVRSGSHSRSTPISGLSCRSDPTPSWIPLNDLDWLPLP